jgi:hypothetical protein
MQQPRSRARTAFAVVAASALLVAGVATVSEAAGGAKSVLLGKNNKATKTTKITNKKAKPALALKSKKGPALSVNTSALIKNLNADMVDGKSLEQISPTKYRMSVFASNTQNASGDQYVSTTALPAGTYSMHMSGIMEDSDELVACIAVDYTRLLATDLSGYYMYHFLDDATTPEFDIASNTVAEVIAGNRVLFGCSLGAAGTVVARAPQLILEKIEDPAPAPGAGPFVPRGEGRDALNRPGLR